MALLIMECGPQAGKTFPLDAQEVTLGRSSANGVVLDLLTISRQHARILREADTYVLEDLQSTNGTFLNGKPITRSPLREGDRIRLGQVVLRFALSSLQSTEPGVELVATGQTTDTASVLERVGVEGYDPLIEEPALGPAGILERLALVSRTTAELLQVLDPIELAERVAERVLGVFPGAEQSLVALTEPDTETLTPYAVRRRGTRQGTREVTLSQTILQLVTEEREAVLCADVHGDARFRDRPSVVGASIRSFLCVPLVCRDEFLGLLYVDTHRLDSPFEREDLLLATAIAGQVALAVSNIRLHRAAVARERLELDLSLAEQLQRSFLPADTPDIPDTTFATYYTTAYEVGGDFYDFVPVDDYRWLIVIGDASGKGIPAALVMARLTRDIRYHALRAGPAVLLGELSQSLARQSERGVFATLLCLELQPAAHRVVVASAGHRPLLVCPQGDEPYFFTEVTGFPLGVVPEEPYDEAVLTLKPGDCLLAYTDGVTEAMNAAGVTFGEQRLLDAVAEAASRPTKDGVPANDPQRLLDEVLLVLRAFRGNAPPTDDLTMVAFRSAGGDGPS